MEHRNSTVLSSSGALRNPGQRMGLLGTVAHEFFHAWNMERIRSRDLEPFNFEEADVSGELWLGEGFTSYYDDLILRRTGLTPLEQTLNSFANTINAVTLSPARTDSDRGRHESAGAVRRRRGDDRPHGMGQHVHFVLHVWRRNRSGTRFVAPRSLERPHDARHLYASTLGQARTAGTAAARHGCDAVHDGGPRGSACRGERRRRLCPEVLRRTTSRVTTLSITRPCWDGPD